jgi:peptide chain release factor 1
MKERLEIINERYNTLCEELLKPEVYEDYKKMQVISKEKYSLETVVETYKRYNSILDDIEAAKEMSKDPEMKDFAVEELDKLHIEEIELENKLKRLLLPKDPNDEKNVIVEIRGAAGGDEANIFAGDLFRMYEKYAENQGWKYDITHEVRSESGGYSQIEFMLSGEAVYSKMKYESGAHRVQRVPETEAQGRIHTSTATVLVMPEAEEIDIEIKDSDIRVDITRSSGAGGQCVNTTDSAVRLTHISTGIVVYCQVERSQIKNKEKALQILKTRLYDLKTREQEEKVGNERRSKIGTGDRSEKIRTYNYPQNRFTDHRINYTVMHLDRIMEGDLEEVIQALIAEDERMKLGEQND